jgi:hypothetical protein
MASHEVTARRFVKIVLDVPGSLQGLIDQLVDVAAKPATGPDSQVQQISGGGITFEMVLLKPEN